MPLDRQLLPGRDSGRGALAGAIGLGALGGLVVIVQAALLSRIVAGAFLAGTPLSALGPWLAALGAAALARAAAAWGAEVAAARAAAALKQALRARLAAALVARGPAGLAAERTGEVAAALVRGVGSLDAYVARYLPQLALAFLVPLLVGAAVLLADPVSALVLVLTWPLIPLFMFLIGSAARERTRRQWVTLSRMSARFLDAVQGLATLKAFGRDEAEADAIERASERFGAITMRVLRLAFVSALALELLATIATALVAVGVGLRLLYGRMPFEDALFVLVLAPEFYRPLRALGAAYHAGMAGEEAGPRIAELLAGGAGQAAAAPAMAAAAVTAAPMARCPAGPGPDADAAGAGTGRGSPRDEPGAAGAAARACGAPDPWPARSLLPPIVFDEVRVVRAGGRAAALDGVSFVLEPGSMLALVGPSGAGKTTVAEVLLRFLEPAAGRVLVGGTPLAAFDPESWRGLVAWVPQRPHLFHGSVADNIRLGRADAPMTAVREAARLAHADEFILRLPQGYDTPVGERGARLSGGQAQRIAIARALLKDAPLVVLDEPTSQVDPATERVLAAALGRLRAGRTMLVIAHRASTVRAADRAVVLSNGRVVETGRGVDLLERGALWTHLAAVSGGGP
jgi:ATP-binding cassette subfamily C protein CydD